jgi:hypothetical protein
MRILQTHSSFTRSVRTAQKLLLLVGVSIAFAAPSDGVRCPIGYDTQYDVTHKVMRCERQSTLIRPAICDPAAPEYLIYRVTKGKDYCVRPADADAAFSTFSQSDQRRRAVTCASDSNGGRWHVEVDDSGERDRCKSVRSEWIYPSQQ